ncbi:MAG: FHA domain-containing protein [Chloroflexota bacterium]|nr:FHA domain-containing protein [Chloroflexota bacterium]MBI5703261.1 FHA domain-containing protein [Chloroflexota bacterium]
MPKFIRFLLTLSLLAGTRTFAHAQSASSAEVARIDASDFPQISALVDVYGADGNFLAGLKAADVTVYEDGQERPPVSLREVKVPVQAVTAVNPGPPLGIRDGTGISRFERVVEALRLWAEAQPADSRDDFSLVSLSGSLINHAGVNDWLVSLNAFKPDFRNSKPNLQTLAIALDTVSAPTPEPGMKRAVLFITPALNDPNIDNSIAPFIQRAVEAKVRVFVWFVDAEAQFLSPSANAFKLLAQQSGGQFFAFSRNEPFPNLDEYFAPLRSLYEIQYTSALNTSGEHTLRFDFHSGETTISTADAAFSVEVQPPNPIFVTPPLQITRQPPADDPYNPEILEPAQRLIEIIVEFPDGHPRDLARTTLYVDGQVTAENTQEPFDRFVWDLSAFAESGQHQIVVEAEDVLGLTKSSIAIPVTFTVIHPPGRLEVFLLQYRSHLIFGATILAGFALLAVLVRSRAKNLPESRRKKARRAKEDPLTQPVPALAEPPIPPKKGKTSSSRFGWMNLRHSRVPSAPAYLIRLKNGGEPASAAPIPLLEKETTFGADPVQSMHVLDDPSISPLHARIRRMGEGNFLLMDHGSVAGTWLNYEPVSREGVRLKHGDRIHFGMMYYRFDLSQPPAESEPKVISKNNPHP